MKEYTVICFITSHLLQMRGLKRLTDAQKTQVEVASFTDAWIETTSFVALSRVWRVSHLLQMRGLKHFLSNPCNSFTVSHLLQMRGLKLNFKNYIDAIKVASFTDAWIETCFFNFYRS